ncbi:hypothetical protein PVAND_008153 [Polypedilum vanderplanki]|uniref:AAA+ ATPase domain-containing protein n=1 Tax=Polypedilum vanderplanki TaxID=319348 RepID=A0A9J6C9P3_POLVA|nr:hypothetical protein PVAND_008153 [Polypedilum vanderplanki]
MKTEIEIAKLRFSVPQEEIEKSILEILSAKRIHKNSLIIIPSKKFEELNVYKDSIQSISVGNVIEKYDSSSTKFFYYEFSDHIEPEIELIESHEEEQINASTHWILPNKQINGLWESLIYDNNLKEDLLDFAKTMLLFSNMNVDQNIISCNRIILLHGLPGTGKTSLAKALAQKLSIQLNDKYFHTHLFEINSHSLFSKWFSESAKLIQKMFQQIQEVIEIPSSLVVILIDEVESIAFARGNIATNEPSDSVRVVNAVLTQLDKIKKYPNVLIITTSNLTKSIDLAFLDRADIVRFLENPSTNAIYRIISSAIVELASKGLIIEKNEENGNKDEFSISIFENNERLRDIEKFPSLSNIMIQICQEAVGISGRGLRKLPFLAHALFLKKESATLREFLIAMRYAIDSVKKNNENIGQFNQIKEFQ